MLLLKKALDLCESTARASALESVVALAEIDPNKRPVIAQRIYLACRAQDGERGYFGKKIEPSYHAVEDPRALKEKQEREKYRAARSLGLNQDAFSSDVEGTLCDAFEALSGHSLREQQKIAATLVEVVTKAGPEMDATAAKSRALR
jgi:hypothetical protein